MDKATLIRLHAEGLNDRQIAQKLNVNPSTVFEWQRKLGLPANFNKEWNPRQIKEAYELYKQGFTTREIAKKIGIPYAVLLYHFKRKFTTRSRGESITLAFCRYGTYLKRQKRVWIPKEKWKLAYLAGLIDGEGSVYWSYCQGRLIPNIKVANTDKKMIDWIIENFGGRVNDRDRTRPRHWKKIYHWCVSSLSGCYLILLSVSPYLITKKEKAEELLERIRNDKRFQILMRNADSKTMKAITSKRSSHYTSTY
jgi:AcrR family transcriptional regulator